MSTYADPADDNRDAADFIVSMSGDEMLRLKAVNDAAMVLLRNYFSVGVTPTWTAQTHFHDLMWNLKESTGLSLKELRGGT